MSSAALEDMLRALRALGTLPADVARIAAPLVQEALQSSARAGTDPEGKTWQPKKGGGAPLVHAADHIATSAIGPVVRSTLTGVDVYHHFGAGVPKRRILPDPGTIPPLVAEALDRAAELAFARAVQL